MLTRQKELSLIARYQNANNKEDQQEAERLLKDAYRERVNDTIQEYLGSPSLPEDDWFARTLGSQLGEKRPSEVLSESAWQGFFEAVTDFDLKQKRDFWPYARKKILLRLDLSLIARYQDKTDPFGSNLALLLLMRAYRRNIRYQAWQFSPRSAGQERELVESEASYGFWKAVERFDLTRRTRLWTYAKWWVRLHLGKYVANLMGLSEDGYRVYKMVVETQIQLSEELNGNPTKIPVADKVVADKHPYRRWSEKRLRRAVKEVLEALDRQFVELEEESGEALNRQFVELEEESSDEVDGSCDERLQQLYKQVLSALKKEVYVQKFITLSVVRVKWDKYHWVDVVCALKRNADDCGENPLYHKILSQWTDVCQEYLLFCFQIPCNWDKVCESFEPPPPPKLTLALPKWYRLARHKVCEHHYKARKVV